ncbi:MAG TPA: hypothetical protein VF234_03910 [Limnochordia bacterium]
MIGRLGRIALLISAFAVAVPVQGAAAAGGRWLGWLGWSADVMYGSAAGRPPRLTVPEVEQRLELQYVYTSDAYQVQLRAGSRGVWGASPYNAEPRFGPLSLDEAFAMIRSGSGLWSVGRHFMLLPYGPDDFRALSLLVGNPSVSLDGLSWYRPFGAVALEGAVALLHADRDPNTGRLEAADGFAALRLSGQTHGVGWELSYAPTLLVSDVVDSRGWGLPFRFQTVAHRVEGAVASYFMTGSSQLPTGWESGWLVRYVPLRTLPLPLLHIEVARIGLDFVPYLGNFADRGGMLEWKPGESGAMVRFAPAWGDVEIGWKRSERRLSPEALAVDRSLLLTWYLPWRPPPITGAALSLIRREGSGWEARFALDAGVRF